jgi:hypothetical protein
VLIRVNFMFPTGNEVRYLERLPMRGGTMLGHGVRWCVSEVEKDVTGGYSVRLLELPRRLTHRRAGQRQRLSAARPDPQRFASSGSSPRTASMS